MDNDLRTLYSCEGSTFTLESIEGNKVVLRTWPDNLSWEITKQDFKENFKPIGYVK